MSKEEIVASLSWATSFARSCAAKFPNDSHREDLMSVGILAYLQAACRYRSRLGASFRGYCATRIRGAVLDEMRRWTWAPRSVLQNRRRIRNAHQALTCRLQREPTRKEMAAELHVGLKEFNVIDSQSQFRQVISLDDSSSLEPNEEHVSLAERIPDPHVALPSAQMLSADDRQMMIGSIRTLPKVQATIIVLHYLKNVPLGEIAALMAVTPSRISQLHHTALDRMRRACGANGEVAMFRRN